MTTTDLDIMNALDAGTNMFGALRPEVRARLFAVIDNPTDETWSDAHGIVISDVMTTLWKALLRHTDYQITGKPSDGPWPAIPTRDQIMTALRGALNLS